MNGTSGFQEVQSSTSRSQAYRLLHEQRQLFGVGLQPLLTTEELSRLAPHVHMMKSLTPSLNRIAFLTYKNTKTELVRKTFRVSKEIFVKAEGIHFKQGWCAMKAGSYLLVATLMAVTVTLFLAANSASASDTMPHYGKTTSACSNHMVNGTHTGTGPYTFRLCRALSNATHWKAQLINVVTLVPLTYCQVPYEPAQNQRDFTCQANQIPAGTYLASITYWIPGGTFTHAHYYYIKP